MPNVVAVKYITTSANTTKTGISLSKRWLGYRKKLYRRIQKPAT